MNKFPPPDDILIGIQSIIEDFHKWTPVAAVILNSVHSRVRVIGQIE